MPSTKSITIHIDGASRGNPGPAAYAVIVGDGSGAPVASFSEHIGRTTNNVAEYRGLLAALDYAIQNKLGGVKVISDSELLVRQIKGQYKVKSADLRPLYDQAVEMIRRIHGFSIAHVLREQNREADKLANVALDRASGKSAVVSDPPRPAKSSPIHGRAKYGQGVLKLEGPLPLEEDEEVEIEVRRRPPSD